MYSHDIGSSVAVSWSDVFIFVTVTVLKVGVILDLIDVLHSEFIYMLYKFPGMMIYIYS